MIKRIIAVIAALGMLYGSTLIPQAKYGDPIAETEQNVLKTKVEKPKTEIKELKVKPVIEVREHGTEISGISEPVWETEDTLCIVTDEAGVWEEPEAEDTGNVAEYEQESCEPDTAVEIAAESEPEAQLSDEDETFSEPEMEYLGDWIATGYCPAECCCGSWAWGATASGVMPTANHTVACNSLPFGTQLMIDGIVYTVEDTGWSPYGDAWVDIFFDTHSEALAWGERTVSVYLVR